MENPEWTLEGERPLVVTWRNNAEEKTEGRKKLKSRREKEATRKTQRRKEG